MKLSIAERILIHGLFPQQSDYETMKDLLKVRDLLKFTEEENRKYDVSQENAPNGGFQVKFNQEVAEGYEVDFKIPPRVASVVTEQLQSMNQNKQLTEQLLSLYEKFCL